MATIGKTHGEIISWDMPTAVAIPLQQVKDALTTAGLDAAFCRDRTARAAFSRACWTLADGRIIRKVEETPAVVLFQFTKERKDKSAVEAELVYEKEAVLMLDKKSGKVSAGSGVDQNLVAMTQAELDRESTTRYPSDITRIVQRLCNAKADLFPVRTHGGCYFVPDCFVEFVEQLDKFLELVGGSLRRFPIPAGTVQGDRSVKASVEEGLRAMIREYADSIAKFDITTRDSTIEAVDEKIQTSRFKLQCYAEFLAEKQDELRKEVDAAELELKAKLSEIGRAITVSSEEPDAEAVRDAAAAKFDAIVEAERVRQSDELNAIFSEMHA